MGMTIDSVSPRFGMPRIWYPSVGSTMDVAATLAAAGAPHGMVVEAEHQTAGRGRLDRAWQAPPGSSLLASWLLRAPTGHDPAVLSPMVALALLRALRSINPSLPLAYKWPNDIWLEGRKLAGILLTSRAGSNGAVVIAGTGINVGPVSAHAPDRSWLANSMPDIGIADVRVALSQALDTMWQEYLASDVLTEDARDELDRALLWRGSEVVMILPNETVCGRIAGIAPDGALRMALGGGQAVRSFHAGEVVRGPRIPEESAS